MIKIDLPTWFKHGQIRVLAALIQQWFSLAETWLRYPFSQFDVETCHINILNLIAYQRNIERFRGEPLSLYRLRIKHAYINAVDAGSTVGLKRIFERLGIGILEIEERSPDTDWDIVTLRLSDTQLSNNSELIRVLLNKYGRTCRRYEFLVITPLDVKISTIEFNNVWDYDHAK